MGWSAAGLWLAVVASGVYHGLNPGMGWPLAVSAGLMGRGRGDLVRALGPLAAGHLAAMFAVLLPFGLMLALVDWSREIRIGAACLVLGFGLYRLVVRRHPRGLARIPPGRLALWSFAVAVAHGAGLMLLPVYLGICGEGAMAGRGVAAAGAVAAVHALAMLAAGGGMALAVHGWLGMGVLRRSWFDLDRVWALSLALVGGVALAGAAYHA